MCENQQWCFVGISNGNLWLSLILIHPLAFRNMTKKPVRSPRGVERDTKRMTSVHKYTI